MKTKLKYVMKQNRKLLWVAKNIFGPSVINAWVVTMDFGSNSEKKEKLKRIAEKIDLAIADTDISYDSETIVFEFTGGARVYFSNSEWASFGSAGENYKELR